MVEETMNAIRETEKRAEEVISRAGQERDQILADAENEARDILKNARTEAETKAAEALAMERAVGEQQLRKAMEQTDAEIAALKSQAQAREQEVIAAVVAALA